MATGYRSMTEGVVRPILGDAVADRVGSVWGLDEEGEIRNTWKRTPQPGLWFMGGTLVHCRIYSKYLAFQVRLAMDGHLC